MEFIKYFEECVGGRIATCADKRETITVKQKTFFSLLHGFFSNMDCSWNWAKLVLKWEQTCYIPKVSIFYAEQRKPLALSLCD